MYQYKPIHGLQSENSYLYLLKFTQAAQANDRVYLSMDSEIDRSRIVGIETHYYVNLFGLFTWDIGPTMDIDGVTYNVISAAELNGMTLTLVNKKRQQVLSQYPFSALVNQVSIPYGVSGIGQHKNLPKYDLDILSGESYVTFNVNSVIAAPFVAPITFYFDDKK